MQMLKEFEEEKKKRLIKGFMEKFNGIFEFIMGCFLMVLKELLDDPYMPRFVKRWVDTILDAVWLGELPLLALVQLPKTLIAGWLRTEVVMPLISTLGFSSGSFSPDFLIARPYALALAYVLLLGPVLILLWISKCMTRPARWWAWVAMVVAAIDFGLTLWLAGGPGLSVY